MALGPIDSSDVADEKRVLRKTQLRARGVLGRQVQVRRRRNSVMDELNGRVARSQPLFHHAAHFFRHCYHLRATHQAAIHLSARTVRQVQRSMNRQEDSRRASAETSAGARTKSPIAMRNN